MRFMKNIQCCAAVNFSTFAKNPTASFAGFVGLGTTPRRWRNYLLVRHTDCVQLVHWTRASLLAQIREQGLVPNEYFHDFGPGIYCFRAQGHDNFFVRPRVAEECEATGDTIIPVLFTAPEWYECVATAPHETEHFSYCYVNGGVLPAQFAAPGTALPDKFHTVAEELAAMGMSVEYQRDIGINTASMHYAAESLTGYIWGPLKKSL